MRDKQMPNLPIADAKAKALFEDLKRYAQERDIVILSPPRTDLSHDVQFTFMTLYRQPKLADVTVMVVKGRKAPEAQTINCPACNAGIPFVGIA